MRTSDPQEQTGIWRAAIGRSYYAALGTACNHLRDVQHDPHVPAQRVHEYVRRQFQGLRRDRVEYLAAATYLRRLHRLRNWADYDATERDDLASVASDAVEDGRRALRWLEAVTP